MREPRSEGLRAQTVWGVQVAGRIRGRWEPLEGFEQRCLCSTGSLWLLEEHRLQGGGQRRETGRESTAFV